MLPSTWCMPICAGINSSCNPLSGPQCDGHPRAIAAVILYPAHNVTGTRGPMARSSLRSSSESPFLFICSFISFLVFFLYSHKLQKITI